MGTLKGTHQEVEDFVGLFIVHDLLAFKSTLQGSVVLGVFVGGDVDFDHGRLTA